MRRGGMEAIYDDVAGPIGMLRFAPVLEARGAMFGSAQRMAKVYDGTPVVSEEEHYRA